MFQRDGISDRMRKKKGSIAHKEMTDISCNNDELSTHYTFDSQVGDQKRFLGGRRKAPSMRSIDEIRFRHEE